MRLLIVEDSDRLRESLCIGLRNAGYAVDDAANGREGLRLASAAAYDVIILDLMLPQLDGLSVLAALRTARNDTHVLILTARDRVEDRVKGLRAGADDYLIKPFAFDELLARVETGVRRRHNTKQTTFTVGDVTVDLTARAAFRGRQRIDLTAREFAVLECLLLRRGQTLSRTVIEAHIYDDRADLMSNVVDTVVYALRRKLDPEDAATSLICTRRGQGYEIEAEAE